MEFLYNSLSDGATAQDEIVQFSEAFSENYVWKGNPVFIPDFMDYSSKSAQFSLDNYLLEFSSKYKSYIDNGILLEFRISNMKLLESFWTDDKNGVMLSVIYDNVLQAEGKQLYKGKSQAVIVFPKHSNPTEFRIKQLSSYKGGSVPTGRNGGRGNSKNTSVSRQPTRSSISTTAAGSNAASLYSQAQKADKSLQYEKAVQLYADAIKAGSVEAMVKMGMNYQYGYGDVLAKDFEKAATLYARATELGSIEGCYRLAMCLRRGQGVPKDVSRARTLFEHAAQNGHKQAALELRKL